MNLKIIKRAIISVSDKSNLKLILPTLKKFNIEIISSGGSFKKIKSMKYNCIDVSNYTGFSEILDGRLKTLHPKIHAGILNIRKNKKHKKDLEKQNFLDIDLVIVDLYPFEKQLKEKIKFQKLIEYIDIGGSAMIGRRIVICRSRKSMGNGDKAGLGTYLQSRPSLCIKKLSGSWFSNLSGNQDLIINRRFKATVRVLTVRRN